MVVERSEVILLFIIAIQSQNKVTSAETNWWDQNWTDCNVTRCGDMRRCLRNDEIFDSHTTLLSRPWSLKDNIVSFESNQSPSAIVPHTRRFAQAYGACFAHRWLAPLHTCARSALTQHPIRARTHSVSHRASLSLCTWWRIDNHLNSGQNWHNLAFLAHRVYAQSSRLWN